MWNSVNRLDGSKIAATDGEIGHVKEVYFDDHAWVIRYLVIDTGNWIAGREVLVSPYSVQQPLGSGNLIEVSLSRQQVEDSPVIDTQLPVSHQHERDFLRYYTYPEYWAGGDLWGASGLPLLTPPFAAPLGEKENEQVRDEDVTAQNRRLRSSDAVTGYDIQATDDSIGHVKDFIFDDESWAIRYLVVDTRNWWPGGKKVLLATRWIERIDWVARTVHTALTREQVKTSPEYDERAAMSRDYEKKLHAAYDREGYWD
ncbi:MAG TPA: PRC-barrel domain-containing protein [Ideonella sp.]|nr:PRC-barrel domain-containing protein [Ideonella sp.]